MAVTDKEKYIIVHFDPWNFSNPNQLLSQFFVRLASVFQSKSDKSMSAIGQALEQYSEAFGAVEMIPVIGTSVNKITTAGIKALGRKLLRFSPNSDISQQKERVIELMKKQDRRVLVVIDDIDRLSNDQIRSVFQLITSVAKFPKTIYLLAFDRAVVTRALEEVQQGDGNEYLEKIIQMPIQIPDIKRQTLRKVLVNRLEEIVNIFENTTIEPEHWQEIFRLCLSPVIKNLRDVNRLCNTLQFKLQSIAEEINFADMVGLTTLEIHYPTVYEWIKHNKSLLTGSLDLENIDFKEKTQKEWLNLGITQLNQMIGESNQTQNNSNNTENLIEGLAFLFPVYGQRIGKYPLALDNPELRRNNRVGHSERFDRYFNLDLNDIRFRKADIQQAAEKMSFETLIMYLLELDRNDESYEFLEDLYAASKPLSSDRLEIIGQALAQVSAQFDSGSSNRFFPISSERYAGLFFYKILERLEETRRYGYIESLLINSDHNCLSFWARLLRMFEKTYDRFSEGNAEDHMHRILTLSEVSNFERVFIKRTKELLLTKNLFDFPKWEYIYSLLVDIEADYVRTYLQKAFINDKNTAMFLSHYVSAWTGHGISYEVNWDKDTSLTKDQAFEAIGRLRDSGEFFVLPEDVQYKCGALFLHEHTKQTSSEHIEKYDISNLLADWKSKYEEDK